MTEARLLALEIADRIETLGPVTVGRFFSGAGLAAGGVLFAFVVKGSLYFRVDDETRAAFEAMGSAPFGYARRTRSVTVPAYYVVPDEVMEDADLLGQWAVDAHRAAAAAKPRRRKTRRGLGGVDGPPG